MKTVVTQATEAIAALDPVMAAHISAVGPCGLRPRPGGRSHFEQIARSVAYQQLAGAAASAIWGRVRALVEGPFVPEAVTALSEDQLRGAGLSSSKVKTLYDLADHVEDGRVSLARIARLGDDEVIEQLSRVRGIGRWTAEMFLMFQLCRLDVWPVGDLGVRNGYRVLYRLDGLPSVAELSDAGERFRPYRSVAAWYCWRAVDTKLPADGAK